MSKKLNPLGPDKRLTLKYKGIFDLQELYALIKKWYDDRKFEFHEYNYKAKQPSVGELDMFFRGYRNDSEWLRIWVEVYIKFWDLEDIEVIKEGRKTTMNRGRLRIYFEVDMEYDYENKFESSKFMEAVREFYVKFIWLRKFQVYADKIEYEVHGFSEQVKQFLNVGAKGNQFADMW
jgi:hypothetical protein